MEGSGGRAAPDERQTAHSSWAPWVIAAAAVAAAVAFSAVPVALGAL